MGVTGKSRLKPTASDQLGVLSLSDGQGHLERLKREGDGGWKVSPTWFFIYRLLGDTMELKFVDIASNCSL